MTPYEERKDLTEEPHTCSCHRWLTAFAAITSCFLHLFPPTYFLHLHFHFFFVCFLQNTENAGA
jgi:hypothetical protein